MFFKNLLETAQNSPFKTPLSVAKCDQAPVDEAPLVKSRSLMAFATPEGGMYILFEKASG